LLILTEEHVFTVSFLPYAKVTWFLTGTPFITGWNPFTGRDVYSVNTVSLPHNEGNITFFLCGNTPYLLAKLVTRRISSFASFAVAKEVG